MAAKSTGVRVEVVVFMGRRYRRYPDAKQLCHRKYFGRSGALLHRDVWESVHGPIPKGCEIHHRNEDAGDNRVENLELVTPASHQHLHKPASVDRGRSAAHLAHLDAIRPSAAAWHRSSKGRKWHSDNAKKCRANGSFVAPKPVRDKPKSCYWCGSSFLAASSRAKFCGAACQLTESAVRRGKLRPKDGYPKGCVQPDSGGIT